MLLRHVLIHILRIRHVLGRRCVVRYVLGLRYVIRRSVKRATGTKDDINKKLVQVALNFHNKLLTFFGG